jgi:hypothetical protein
MRATSRLEAGGVLAEASHVSPSMRLKLLIFKEKKLVLRERIELSITDFYFLFFNLLGASPARFCNITPSAFL